jgi:hypothetical protein
MIEVGGWLDFYHGYGVGVSGVGVSVVGVSCVRVVVGSSVGTLVGSVPLAGGVGVDGGVGVNVTGGVSVMNVAPVTSLRRDMVVKGLFE